MGSGIGSRRRATMQFSVPIGGFDWKPWDDFLSAQGVARLDLAEYYLGHETRKDRLSETEALQIVNDLFRDLITFGTITLPVGHNMDEYSFRIIYNRLEKFGYDTSSLELVQTNSGHGREVTGHILSALYAAPMNGIKTFQLYRRLKETLSKDF
jgi:hypothetical protein